MEIELKEKPKKGAIIIEGFPGFGLVSTIATEYLIEHLDAKPIGRIKSEKISPIIALHKGEVLEPLGVFYAQKANIIIVRGIAPIKDIEWEVTKTLIKFSKDIKAKEIISVEGISSDGKPPEPEAFYYSNAKNRAKKFETAGLKKLDEGVIVGVTAGMLTSYPELTCIFSEAYSNLPDSRAAAKTIEVLDQYLNLKIDYKPLLKKAETFEKKIKGLLAQGMNVSKQADKKSPESYFG
ncbi:proteasome assembly chaperone family protein [Nanoarchaeota archaeon]